MRADKFLADRFGSRTKAQQALQKGLVLRDGNPLLPKDDVKEGDRLIFLEEAEHFVSNGGYKLARGLAVFCEDVSGCVIADLGASTGGFTDCLLQRGAKRVYCVDVGRSQLDKSIASDPRVSVMDGTNARYLKRESFPEPIDCVTADLSFISLRLVLPAVAAVLAEGGRAFLLFKPQFETAGDIGKSGILPRARHVRLLRDFYLFCTEHGMAVRNIVNAPLREGKNVEYMLHLKKGGDSLPIHDFLGRAADLEP